MWSSRAEGRGTMPVAQAGERRRRGEPVEGEAEGEEPPEDAQLLIDSQLCTTATLTLAFLLLRTGGGRRLTPESELAVLDWGREP